MYQKPCRLTIADKYYGGGGGPQIPQRNLGEELGGILRYLPKFTRREYQLTGQFAPKFAGLDINLLRQYAPQYLGLNLQELQRNIAGQPLLSELNKQAQSELALGGQLSPSEVRNVTQQTRAGFAARGNVIGNQALGAELLGREQYSRQRATERRGFAEDVLKLNLGTLGGLGGVSTMGAGFGPLAAGIGAAGQVANPLLQYGSDLYSSNQSAAATQAMAGANKSAGTTGGVLGAVGQIGGAALTAY